MKIRSVKLREAHKGSNGGRSFCSILWDNGAHHIVTSSSSDASISIYDSLLLSAPPKALRHHRDGVTALALSPNSTCLASGSIDHSVKLYKFPSGEFETNITRFTLPIRALAFNKSGSMLAAAGDDEGIKLINTVDGTIARILKGHKGPVTCLAFDPNGEYLASVDSKGTVMHWELNSGEILHNLKGVAPDTGSDMSVMNVLGWSPDGELLSVPGIKNDVVMYDRDTAEKLFSLRGDHAQSICFLSWSPNGKYLATSSLDKQVLIWDIEQRQDIDRQKFDERICCMAWKPTGNALAVIDVMGKYGVWESVIPSSMKSPIEDIPSSQLRNCNGLLLFDEDEKEPSASGSLSDLAEDSHGESVPPSRKRLRKHSFSVDNSDEDINDQSDIPPSIELRTNPSRVHKEGLDVEIEESKGGMVYTRHKLQEAFQPGATPMQPGTRSFMCYNILGSITTIQHDGYSHVEIDFHDTSQGPRVPPMTDYFGFTMASLNENGSVLANPRKGEKHLSTLMYRPFKSWANNSEWSMRFEEEVKAVALGTAWVAAVTSFNFLRIFTEGGLQRYVISLDGPVVTAAGFRDELAVVTHASQPLPCNDQMLEFRVFSISNGTQPLRGCLPLSPGSYLKWFGFSEEGQLSSYDSKGILRLYTEQFGGSWIPLFSQSKVKKPEETCWVVGLSADKLFCIICKSPDSYPKVTPKPVLTLLDLSTPLACSDLGADTLENEFIMRQMHLLKIQKKIDEMVAAGLDTAMLDDEAFNMEAALDRCILRLIASCCNGDKLVRATELVKLLSLEKSVKGAIKLVTALKLPNLAERFNSILEDRLLNETAQNLAPPVSNSKSVASLEVKPISRTSADVVMNKSPTATSNGATKPSTSTKGIITTEENSNQPSPLLTSPLLRKKASSQDGSAVGKEKSEQNRTVISDNVLKTADNRKRDVMVQSTGKLNGVIDSNEGQLPSSSNPLAKSSKGQDVRPTNPFAKSSSNQEKSSLLDSFKKIKTDAAGRK
ncbi:Protein ENHANCER OF LHP1 1 [Ancistrocladus abbreviatus]